MYHQIALLTLLTMIGVTSLTNYYYLMTLIFRFLAQT